MGTGPEFLRVGALQTLYGSEWPCECQALAMQPLSPVCGLWCSERFQRAPSGWIFTAG